MEEVTTVEQKITYDPSKKYTWKPTDMFQMSGQDFGLILNTIRAILSSEEAAKILLADKTNQAIEKILANAVEAGVVKESPQE